MYCTHCNFENESSSKFCEKCGKSLNEALSDTQPIHLRKAKGTQKITLNTNRNLAVFSGLALLAVVLGLLIFGIVMISDLISPNMPKDVTKLLDRRYSFTTYSIVSYQRAPYPENYPAFGGTTAPKDEAWCIVLQYPGVLDPQDIYHGVIAHRLGRNWSTGGPSGESIFLMLGCTNYR